jgi:hypothetical protein
MNHLNFNGAKGPDATAQKNELKELNKQFTECISKDFLPQFFAGKDVKIEDFCTDLRVRMLSLDNKVYEQNF